MALQPDWHEGIGNGWRFHAHKSEFDCTDLCVDVLVENGDTDESLQNKADSAGLVGVVLTVSSATVSYG